MHKDHAQTKPIDDAAQSSPALSAYDRLIERFGGRQAMLVAHLNRDQSTISKWRSRGVPMESAIEIVEAAARAGVDLSFDELCGWIAADRKRAIPKAA